MLQNEVTTDWSQHFYGKNEKVIVYKHFSQRAPIKIGQKTTGNNSRLKNEHFDAWVLRLWSLRVMMLQS